jgi:hypothetical protein
MAGPTWTATNGGLIGGGIGLVGGAGLGYALGKRPVRRQNMAATTLGAVLGTAVGGLVGAMLGQRSHFNAWTAASQACPGQQVADWQTFQCANLCADDSVPVNGVCQAYVPKVGLWGTPRVSAPMGLPQLSPRRA